MSILDYFDLNVSVDVTRIAEDNDGDGNPTETPSVVGTFDALFWEGSTGEAFKSDRFREEVSTTIALEPGPTILKDDVATINGTEYHVLGSDNIGDLDEVLIVYLKEFT